MGNPPIAVAQLSLGPNDTYLIATQQKAPDGSPALLIQCSPNVDPAYDPIETLRLVMSIEVYLLQLIRMKYSPSPILQPFARVPAKGNGT